MTNNFNHVIIIHTKSNQNNDFDAFTALNQLADNRAKKLANSALANNIPRMRSNSESESEHNPTVSTRQISQSEDNNDEGHKERTTTPQRTDKRLNETSQLDNDIPPPTMQAHRVDNKNNTKAAQMPGVPNKQNKRQ